MAQSSQSSDLPKYKEKVAEKEEYTVFRHNIAYQNNKWSSVRWFCCITDIFLTEIVWHYNSKLFLPLYKGNKQKKQSSIINDYEISIIFCFRKKLCLFHFFFLFMNNKLRTILNTRPRCFRFLSISFFHEETFL